MEGMGLEHVMGGGGGFPSDPSPTILAGANGFVVVVLWRAGSRGMCGGTYRICFNSQDGNG